MTFDRATIVVYGIAASQGSVQAVLAGGRPMVRQGGDKNRRQKLGDWRQAVANEARDWQKQHLAAPLDEAAGVEITFFLPRPRSVSVLKRPLPEVKPDLDKLGRAVLDAITGILIVDDARVTDFPTRKRYADDGPPRVEISVWRVAAVDESIERHPAGASA